MMNLFLSFTDLLQQLCMLVCFCSAALERAKMLIHMKHGMARLDNVWGVGGGQRPVMFLISKVHILHKDTHEETIKEKSSPITLQGACSGVLGINESARTCKLQLL